MPQTALKIDRFLLNLPGGSAADGRRVAELVAAGLAAAGSLPQAGDLPRLSLVLETTPGTSVESLADRIVQAALRALARDL